jgi:hypothetical protein
VKPEAAQVRLLLGALSRLAGHVAMVRNISAHDLPPVGLPPSLQVVRPDPQFSGEPGFWSSLCASQATQPDSAST